MKNKNSLLISSILLLLIIYSYIQKYFSSVLNFSGKHYRSTGGDGLTDGLFLELFLYACIILFYLLNSILLISYIKKKNKKGIITASFFLVLLVAVQITVSKVRQYKRTVAQEEKLLWVKRAKTIDYKSDNLKIAFTYTDIMPELKKVTVQEKGNQIKIYTQGFEERADRIILLKKDTTSTLLEFLTEKRVPNARFFESDDYTINKKLQAVEMYSFDAESIQKHIGISFKELGISEFREIEKIYFFSNKKYPSRYYAIILMPANEKAAAKPRLEPFNGLDGYTYYSIDDKWYKYIDILE